MKRIRRFGAVSWLIVLVLFDSNARHHTAGEYAIEGDPFFVAASATLEADSDFRLQADSPARDAGADTGLPRFADTLKDLGAYEFGLPPWSAGLNDSENTP